MFLKIAIAFSLALAAPGIAADEGGTNVNNLTVHEWGTFTSVAGPNGQPVSWTPLSAPSDLPCFVHRRGLVSIKSMGAWVRMETPVLYFYSPVRMDLSVHVGFPEGLITEWYPQASKYTPAVANVNTKNSAVEWRDVRITPGADPQYPGTRAGSHYYAARNTDAAPLSVGGQAEKLIFYRGVGTFTVPAAPAFLADGRLQVRNTGGEPIPSVILFENRNGKVGYRVAAHVDRAVEFAPPELTGDLDGLREKLTGLLVELGLYRKEAEAMLETWRDSWFEEGMRVFYLVPRSRVDELLPLAIDPPPSQVARVFVGRVEVLSPATRQAITAAFESGNTAVLARYGRFLDSFLGMIGAWRTLAMAPATDGFLQARYKAAAAESAKASCVE